MINKKYKYLDYILFALYCFTLPFAFFGASFGVMDDRTYLGNFFLTFVMVLILFYTVFLWKFLKKMNVFMKLVALGFYVFMFYNIVGILMRAIFLLSKFKLNLMGVKIEYADISVEHFIAIVIVLLIIFFMYISFNLFRRNIKLLSQTKTINKFNKIIGLIFVNLTSIFVLLNYIFNEYISFGYDRFGCCNWFVGDDFTFIFQDVLFVLMCLYSVISVIVLFMLNENFEILKKYTLFNSLLLIIFLCSWFIL